MSQFLQNLHVAISRIKPKDLVYPGIALLFVIIVGVLFSFATQFIAKNINDAFSGDTSAESSSLNMANYTIVAKKLGIEVGVQKNITTPPASPVTSTTTETLVVDSPQVLDKKSLTINILNSTSKKGVATTLAQTLESAGFARATTGNEKKLYATTTIFIKDNKHAYFPLLLEAMSKTYPDAIVTTTAVGEFDVIIIIGTK